MDEAWWGRTFLDESCIAWTYKGEDCDDLTTGPTDFCLRSEASLLSLIACLCCFFDEISLTEVEIDVFLAIL